MVQKLTVGTKRLVVGVTGGFGCGKSTVLGFFRSLGARVLDSDQLVHEALEKDHPLFKKIAGLFPGAVLADGTSLDRPRLAAIVFADPAERKALEAVLHPYVKQRIEEEIRRAGEKIVMVEVPLLFESGFDSFCDYTLAIEAAEEAVDRRLAAKGFKQQEISARRSAQLSAREKSQRADYVISNSGDFSETRREAEAVWQRLAADLKKGEN